MRNFKSLGNVKPYTGTGTNIVDNDPAHREEGHILTLMAPNTDYRHSDLDLFYTDRQWAMRNLLLGGRVKEVEAGVFRRI